MKERSIHKLIYISHWRFPSDKTMSPLIMRTCEEFARQGVVVELWVPRRWNTQYPHVDPFKHYGIKKTFTIKKLPVLDLMPLLPGSLGFVLMVVTFALTLWLRSFGLDKQVVWYAHDTRDVVLLNKKNLFIEIHDFYKSSVNWLNKRVLGKARGLIVTNKVKIETLNTEFAVSRDLMLHAPNAVDLERFNRSETREEARERLSLPKDKNLAVYTGSLFEWKGIHTLAEARSYLPGTTEIIFAGGNEQDRKTFQSYIDKQGFSGITLLPLPYEDSARAPLFMRAADVLVLPNTALDEASKYETSPVKLFEYMASGTPIVASDIPSVRNIVSEYEVNFCTPDNPKMLGETIAFVLSHKHEALEKAHHAQVLVRDYSWEKRILSVLSFMNHLIESRY